MRQREKDWQRKDARRGTGQWGRRHKAHLPTTPSPGDRWRAARAPYLLCSDHGDHVRSLLPHHLPEVVASVWQGPLSGDVVPFCPTDHHLEAKGSISE